MLTVDASRDALRYNARMRERLRAFGRCMMGVSSVYKSIVARELKQYASMSWWRRLWFRRKNKSDIFLEAIARMKDIDIVQITKDALGIVLPQANSRFASDASTAPVVSVPAPPPVRGGRRSTATSSNVQNAGVNAPVRLQRTGHVSLPSMQTKNPSYSSSRHQQPPLPVSAAGNSKVDALKEVVVDNGTSPVRVMKLPIAQQPQHSNSDSDGPPPLPMHDEAPTSSSPTSSFNSAQARTDANAGARRLQGIVAREVSSSQRSSVAAAQDGIIKTRQPPIESAQEGNEASAGKKQLQKVAARVVSGSRRSSGTAAHGDGIELQQRASVATVSHRPLKNDPLTTIGVDDDALVRAHISVLRPNSILRLAASPTQSSKLHGTARGVARAAQLAAATAAEQRNSAPSSSDEQFGEC